MPLLGFGLQLIDLSSLLPRTVLRGSTLPAFPFRKPTGNRCHDPGSFFSGAKMEKAWGAERLKVFFCKDVFRNDPCLVDDLNF